LSPLNLQRLAEPSTPYLHQLAEEQPALAGLLLRIESKWDFSLPCAVTEVEEEIHQEAVAEVAAEAEEHQLLRSPRPPLKQLFPKPQTSELWELPQEFSKEIEQKQKTSLMNSNTTTTSIEESPDSILP
jgi:hypothetical protein